MNLAQTYRNALGACDDIQSQWIVDQLINLEYTEEYLKQTFQLFKNRNIDQYSLAHLELLNLCEQFEIQYINQQTEVLQCVT